MILFAKFIIRTIKLIQNMKRIKCFFGLAIIFLTYTSCAVIRPGEAGVKQTLGKFSDKVSTQGTVFYNPFISKVINQII